MSHPLRARIREGMNEASVDVVIPVYNCDQFLSEAVESVLLQHGVGVHLFVIDDGSEVPIRGADLRIPHGGPSAARNAGARICSCPYLAFLDADDAWTPEKLILSIREIGDRARCICTSGIHWDRKRPLLGEAVTFDRLIHRDQILTSPVMTREAFELVGGYNPDLTLAEDLDLAFRSLYAGIDFAHVAEPLVLYRKHEQATTLRHRTAHTASANKVRADARVAARR